jgi:hypothetical protein
LFVESSSTWRVFAASTGSATCSGREERKTRLGGTVEGARAGEHILFQWDKVSAPKLPKSADTGDNLRGRACCGRRGEPKCAGCGVGKSEARRRDATCGELGGVRAGDGEGQGLCGGDEGEDGALLGAAPRWQVIRRCSALASESPSVPPSSYADLPVERDRVPTPSWPSQMAASGHNAAPMAGR